MKRQLLLVSLFTGLSQLAAFFKLWFTAHVFGVSSELDGYNLALVAPTLISGILSGFLQTGLFPVRAQIHQESTVHFIDSFDRTVWWIYAGLGLLLAILLFAISGFLSELVVPSDQKAMLDSFLSVMPIAASLVAVGMITDCTGYLLAMRGSFLISAGAPIISGLFGGIVLAWWPSDGLDSLIWGTVGGATLQLLICVYGLRLTSLSLTGPLSIQDHHRLTKIIKLGAWILPGVILSNLAVSLPPMWAARFGEGAVSAFGYAYRLHLSAVQLLVMASSTLILAKFSVLVASNNLDEIKKLLRKAAIVSAALGLFAVFCVGTVGELALTLLFSGKFDKEAASQVSSLWMLLSFGLGFSLLGNVFAKLWQAQGRPKLLTAMAGVSFFTLWVSFFTLSRFVDEQAIAMALAFSSFAFVLVGLQFLKTTPTKS